MRNAKRKNNKESAYILSKNNLKNYLPQIKEVLNSEDDKIVRLFYEIENETIIGATELNWIIDTCQFYYLDPMPYILGERDVDLLHMLETKMEVDDHISRLPCSKRVEKKDKKEEKGKVLIFNKLNKKSPTS